VLGYPLQAQSHNILWSVGRRLDPMAYAMRYQQNSLSAQSSRSGNTGTLMARHILSPSGITEKLAAALPPHNAAAMPLQFPSPADG
jgi:hypothetical protein